MVPNMVATMVASIMASKVANMVTSMVASMVASMVTSIVARMAATTWVVWQIVKEKNTKTSSSQHCLKCQCKEEPTMEPEHTQDTGAQQGERPFHCNSGKMEPRIVFIKFLDKSEIFDV